MTAPYAPSWAPVPPPPPTRRDADVSLVLGLLSLPFTFLTGIPAVVFGVRALRVVGQVGGRGRAWTGVVLGSVMTLVAAVVLVGLGLRVADGVRDVTAPAGSERAQQRDAERAAQDDAALEELLGVPVAQLETTPGVLLEHDPGATVDCLDSCSAVTMTVSGAAAQRGPLALQAVRERVRAGGWLQFDGTPGCPPPDPARSCDLTRRGSGSLSLSLEDDGYALRVDGGA